MIKKVQILFLALFFLSLVSHAGVPVSFTYQGKLFDVDNITPLSGSVDFKIQIFDPTATCLLYEEGQSNISIGTDGLFSLQVGSALASLKRGDRDPGLTMEKVFSNQNIPIRGSGDTDCPSGYTPNTGDKRKMKVVVINKTSGVTTTLSPLQEIVMNPFAIYSSRSEVAETLNGKVTTDFIQVDNTSVNQSNVKSLTDKVSDILSLVASGGSSSSSPTGSAGGDLMGTYPNPILKNFGTAGTYTKITTDNKGRVTSGSLINIGDIKSSVTGNFLMAGGACPTGQQLTYLSVSDTLSCQAYSVSSAQVTAALGFTPADSAALNNFVAKTGSTMSGNLDVTGNVKADQLCIGADCRANWPAGGGGGNGIQNVVTVTSNYSATNSNDVILANANAGVVVITLPAAAGNAGKQIFVKKIDSSSNAVKIQTLSGELVDGIVCSPTTSKKNGGLRLISDGTSWWGTDSYNGFAVVEPSGKTTFTYTGSMQNFEVPSCVTSITVKVWGAGGGGVASNSAGGAGAAVVSTIAVTPGETLTVLVGEGGSRGGASVTTPATFGGGGAGGYSPSYPGGGAGGGRSAVRRSSADIVTASGGAGSARDCAGPAGGITTGTTGGNGGSTTGGAGGTQSAGGAAGNGSPASTAGSLYTGGSAGGVSGAASTVGGGGGGGGYYGGGGGGSYTGGAGGGSCGGSGSSLVPAGGTGYAGSGVTPGNNSDLDYVSGVGVGGANTSAKGGNGLVVISW